ncbi:MAG: hypothetical protein PHF63_08035 [Herbinix sp.]|nr:hypothetical protein [Herbinix sp.]
MDKHFENVPIMDKQSIFEKEFNKLTEVFSDVEETKRMLVDGLIEEAAFLYAENFELKKLIKITGTIKCHPQYPDLQKQVPAAGQYLKNLNSYAVVIKTLNGVLMKGIVDNDENMSEFE